VALPDLLFSKRAKRRIVAGLSTVALSAAAMGAMASPASADMRCTGRPDSNVCLDIYPIADQHYHIHLGIDVHMNEQTAQAYIAQGNPFRVTIMAPDHFWTDELFDLPLTDLGASAESGLSADFDFEVPRGWLDEDDNIFDNDDEIYARVALYDAYSAQTFYYFSVQFNEEF
jgi:hypothetical protein